MSALQFLAAAAKYLDRIPPEAITALTAVVRAVASSKDPVRAARLAAMAAASKAGTEAAIKEALKK